MDLRLKFNEDEKNYDKYRPEYPAEMIQDIIEFSSLQTNSKALEIGIGTGQATAPILDTHCSVIAIELGNNLSVFVADKYKSYDNFKVMNADFMTLPVSENTFDLIYCATAFHWLPADDAFQKVLKSLKPQGVIALFWNHPFPNRKEDMSNLVNMNIYGKYRPSNKPMIEFSIADCKKHISKLKEHGFENIQCKLYTRVRKLTTDSYINLLNTYSDHRALPIDIKENFEKDMKMELDKIGGYINIYDTLDLYLAQKP